MKNLTVILLIISFITLTYSSNVCNILALSGGGAHGAFQVGVIDKLNQNNKTWDIITGISAGSLNGALLSLYKIENQNQAVKELYKLWNTITASKVYNDNWFPPIDISIYDNSPLNKTVYDAISKISSIGKRDIIIGATNLNNGNLDLFYKVDLDSVSNITDIVMSSTSIPVVFPPRYFRGNYYVDGGTFSDEIIKPAIKLCNYYNKTDIHIDLVLTFQYLNTISSKSIKGYNLFDMFYRTYQLIDNTVSNHELYTACKGAKHKYPLDVYKPNKPFKGDLLDFNHKDILEMILMGFNTVPTNQYYCF
jgi:NTE family protein